MAIAKQFWSKLDQTLLFFHSKGFHTKHRCIPGSDMVRKSLAPSYNQDTLRNQHAF